MVLEASLTLGRGRTLLPLLLSTGLHRSVGARGQGPLLSSIHPCCGVYGSPT